MSKEQKDDLAHYIAKITHEQKLPGIRKDEIDIIVNEEKQFLPIMYKTLDPARRSINEIVEQEFNRIDNQSIKKCISLCSLSTSLDSEMPISILRKALGDQIGKSFSYPDVFEIINKARAFIIESEDIRTNILFSLYHNKIARHLVMLIGTNGMDECLLSIAKTVDIRSKIEADFISNLLINKGVNLNESIFRPFSNYGLEAAFLEIKRRQPARPIIHHLARLYNENDKSDDRIIPLLMEALAEPEESYSLEERKENVLTTLANIKWEQKKDYLLYQPRANPEIKEIIDLLGKARKDNVINIHPYVVHARILKELWQSKDEETKMALVNEAVEIINEGLDCCSEDPEGSYRLNKLLIESLSEIDMAKAEDTAKSLLEMEDDGTGYYTLARIEYHKNSNPTKALLFLGKALSRSKYPPGAVALKIEIILQDKFPNYENLLKDTKLLSSDIRYKDTFKSAYHKAVVYTINGKYKDATEYFKISSRTTPWPLLREVKIFWMEMGRRKVFTGKIGRPFTERDGYIYSHNFEGWSDNIYFKPLSQKYKSKLRPGLYVDFELGFSPRGPIAWDVRPHESKY